MKFKIGKVITSLTLFSIYLIPLVGLIDFFMSIGILPGMANRSRLHHPFPQIVLIREILIAFLLILLVIRVFRNEGKMHKILFSCVFLLTPLLLHSSNLPIFVSGIRQILYFTYVPLGFFIYNYNRSAGINIDRIIFRALKIVLVIQCILALVQLKFMPAAEGMGHFGPRVLGSFNNPNTLGTFGATTLLILILLSGVRRLSKFYYLCGVIVVLASGTRTATVLLACVLLGALLKRIKSGVQKGIMAVIALSILLFIITSVNIIANKPAGTEYIWKGSRIQNIGNYVAWVSGPRLLCGYGWGVLTSWYGVLGGDRYIIGPRGLDSFYGTVLAQIGLIGLSAFMLYLFWLFSLAGKRGLLLFLFFCLIGGQINILEYYPMNLLIFLALGIFIAKRRFVLEQGSRSLSVPHSLCINIKDH